MRPSPIAALAAGLCLCLGPAAPADEVALDSEDDKTIYALGLAVAQSIEQFALTPNEVEVFLAGLGDALRGASARVPIATYGPKIDALAAARREARAAVERDASRAFLDAAGGTEGAVVTDSGLVYLETQAGGGASPEASDTVEVHYHGTLRDGSVFDSSRERGSPARFPLNRVIPCWTEALQRMKVGGKATITCPAAIAYGDRGSGRIPPGAALRFEVELLSIPEEE